jgi:DNA replicative helicase MCM subunit Mcm2 (Cdc46/Mcm family)
MATKIPAAQSRMFKNVFVCKNCNTKMRADARKIAERKVKCRKCKRKAFRPISKK